MVFITLCSNPQHQANNHYAHYFLPVCFQVVALILEK